MCLCARVPSTTGRDDTHLSRTGEEGCDRKRRATFGFEVGPCSQPSTDTCPDRRKRPFSGVCYLTGPTLEGGTSLKLSGSRDERVENLGRDARTRKTEGDSGVVVKVKGRTGSGNDYPLLVPEVERVAPGPRPGTPEKQVRTGVLSDHTPKGGFVGTFHLCDFGSSSFSSESGITETALPLAWVYTDVKTRVVVGGVTRTRLPSAPVNVPCTVESLSGRAVE